MPSNRLRPHYHTVTVIQEKLTHYRVPFHQQLYERLRKENIEYRLIYGEEPGLDIVAPSWATSVRNRKFHIGRKELVWQPCLRAVADSDLVIVEQASRLLTNYALFGWRFVNGPRIAFWGHGRNLNEDRASRWGEELKFALSRQVDWWFAYTDLSRRIVEGLGFPSERVTTVYNSTDTTELRRIARSLRTEDLHEVRHRTGIHGRSIGLFVGSLYHEKRLKFLIETARAIRASIPDFELVVIGDGPDRATIAEAARENTWIHDMGIRTGEEKVRLMRIADLLLMPGLVGLVATDSFALKLPIVTTEVPYHSPEIDYIANGENGIVLPTDTTPQAFANEVVGLLQKPERLEHLRHGCAKSAAMYSVERMVMQFTEGIQKTLSLSARDQIEKAP